MDTSSSELFGHLVYAESLTYEQLLDIEERITQDIESILESAEADHVDFTPIGDALFFQCSFSAYKQYIFRKIACDLVQILPAGISGRLFCLSHTLGYYSLYYVQPAEWRENRVMIPDVPSTDLKHWHVQMPDVQQEG